MSADPVTASEVRLRQAIYTEKLDAMAKRFDESMRKTWLDWWNRPTPQERAWARLDRCCHEGRNCVPPRPSIPEITWR